MRAAKPPYEHHSKVQDLKHTAHVVVLQHATSQGLSVTING